MGVRSAVLKRFGDDFAWSLLDAAPDATLVVSQTGEIAFVNDHAARLLQYEPRDLLGRVIEDLVPSDLRQVHRADRTRYRAAPGRREMGAGLDLRAVRSDGTEFPVEVSLNPLSLDDELFVIAAIRDVSERVEAEDFMHRVLQTLDASDDAVLILEAETLRYSYVNEGACRMLGYTAAELLDMTPMHLNPYTTEPEYRRLIGDLVGGSAESLIRRTTFLRKDGAEVPLEKTLRSASTGRNGTPLIIALARDISERLSTEEELRQSQRSLEEAERAIAISDDRERIARDLHDTTIQRLFAEGLNLHATLALIGERTPAHRRIAASIDGLDDTIRELRTTIFALEAGSGGRAPSGLRFQLLDVITDSVAALGFEPRLEFEGPVDAVGDEVGRHLVAALRDVLANVARHSGARHADVAVDAHDGVTLTVTDDGVGTADEGARDHGLDDLRARADDLGGGVSVERIATGGTRLVWSVPRRVTGRG